MTNYTPVGQQSEFVQPSISIRKLIHRFWKGVVLTWVLVILEGMSFLILPLVIGKAIDDLLVQSYVGVQILIVLCIVTTTLGAVRRMYDTRALWGYLLQGK